MIIKGKSLITLQSLKVARSSVDQNNLCLKRSGIRHRNHVILADCVLIKTVLRSVQVTSSYTGMI